jgi:3-oxoacyl-[acyl-carrier-protein] synthase-3
MSSSGNPSAPPYPVRIAGTGSYLPERIMTNRELEESVDTSDEWIRGRTGICQRHIAEESQSSSDLAFPAAQAAMTAAGVSAADIDLIIVATSTPDFIFPSTACLLQAKLGIKQGAAFDLQAVCSGFVYALSTADTFIRSGQYRTALVVGAEVFSRILDWTDRGTCVLFGDGAGAVVLEAVPAEQAGGRGILTSHLRTDGRHRPVRQTDMSLGPYRHRAAFGRPFAFTGGEERGVLIPHKS